MSHFDVEFIPLPLSDTVIASEAKQSRTSPGLWISSELTLLAMTTRSVLGLDQPLAPVLQNLFLPIRHAHAGADIVLNAVRRDRLAQPVLGKLFHAGDRLGKIGR